MARGDMIVLSLNGPWQMDHAEDACRSARMFGSGDDKTVFYIERYEPGEPFFLLVAGKPFEGRKRSDVVFQFGPGGAKRENTGERGTLGDYDPAFFEPQMTLLPWPAELMDEDGDSKAPPTPFGRVFSDEQEQTIEWLDVCRGSDIVRLQLTPMGAPMKAMRDCTDTLLNDWGLDVDAHRTMRARPVPIDAGDWMTSSDYPTRSLRKGQQSLLQTRLMVDAQGGVTSCHIQRETMGDGFGDAACKALLHRARFEPALDRDGQPMASYYKFVVRFDIPGR